MSIRQNDSFYFNHESQDYFKKIFESAPIGIIILEGTKIKMANTKFAQLTGYDIKRLQKKDFISFLPQHEDKECAKTILDGLKEDEEAECECTIEGKKGKYFVRIKAKRIGNITVMNIVDISEIRKLMDSSIQGVLIYQDDKIVYANERMERITGYSKEELLNMKPWEIIAEEYLPKLKEIAKLRQKGKIKETKVYEIKIRRKDGKIKWVFISSTTTNYRDKPAGLVTMMDISDIKTMMDIISEREILVQKIFDNASEGIFIEKVEEDKIKIIDVNDAACRMLGYKKEELIGMDVSNIIYPGDKDVPKKMLEMLEKYGSKGSIRFEGRNIRKNGKIIDLEISASWINIEGEKYIMVIARDITEKKIAEEKLAESEAIFRAVAESSPNGIFIAIGDEITFINRAFEKITGYNLEEIKKRGMPYIYGYGDKTEIKIKSKDGKIKWVIFSIKDLNVKDKRIRVGILTDVTDIRMVYETKRKFIEDTSHYFFNPIAIAKGYLELAMEKRDGERDKMLNKVKEAIERIESVVRNIVEKGEIHE
ncbi:MAG: PAS domain S-box protein [Thermoplasmata archaeon]|nr:PAS domain S-box protein [Thermoplasmata archaeon]